MELEELDGPEAEAALAAEEKAKAKRSEYSVGGISNPSVDLTSAVEEQNEVCHF